MARPGAQSGTAARPSRRLRQRSTLPSLQIAFVFCTLVVVLFGLTSPRFIHWFVLPLTGCGVIVTRDAVDWLRGRLDTFSPVGIVGLLGVHFFFIAPLLHVKWDYWLWTYGWASYLPEPADWRVWVGWMAVVNFVGLVLYSITWRRLARRPSKSAPSRIRLLSGRRFWPLVWIALIVSGASQIYVYVRFGGFLGYIEAFETSKRESFGGLGPLFMISESFPVLAMMAYAQFARSSRRARGWLVLIAVLAVFFVLKLVFGGLRGSRSNTVWGVFWAVGIMHFWIRPIPKKAVALGLVVLFAFLYVYGFYKSVGTDAFRAFESAEARERLEDETGRSIDRVLLGDLGRTDVQAYMLYARVHPQSDFEQAWGRTYLAAATLVIPRSIWPGRPDQKVREGTELFFGEGSYVPGERFSSRVYGLAGEAMLNFPAYLAPLPFIALGLMVGWVRKLLHRLHPRDARLLFLPFVISLCFMMLPSDAANLVFSVFKNGFLPAAVIWLGSRRYRLRHRVTETAPPTTAPSAA